MFTVGGGNYIEYQNLMDYSKVCVLLWTFVSTWGLLWGWGGGGGAGLPSPGFDPVINQKPVEREIL